MGSPLSPTIANIYMEWFEVYAIKGSRNRPKLWLRYEDDKFVIWQHGRHTFKNFQEPLEQSDFIHRIYNEDRKERCRVLTFLDLEKLKKPNCVSEHVYSNCILLYYRILYT